MAWLILFGVWGAAMAQKGKTAPSKKDSLDGKFDLSDYLIEANGFIPVPYIITEPALGGFGMAVIPVFIKKRPPYRDSIAGKLVETNIPPDFTGGGLAYTLNNTWMVMGFRSGTLIKSRIKYLIAGGYVNLNMDFYESFSHLGEKELHFNIRTFPLLLQASKRLWYSRWYAGLKYLFLKTKVNYAGGHALDSLAQTLESDKLISALGALVEMDSRDNIFTPNSGMKLHVDANLSNQFFGSDFNFWRMNYYAIGYLPVTEGREGNGKLVTGLRVEGAQVFGDLPFYMKPYVNMRGIPVERYQGNAAVVTEAELRWDVVMRWSAVGFSGVGTAFDDWSAFGKSSWVVSYGAGFRYLLARKFKLRMGIDVAHGPDTWAYYIIFGTNWLR
jgi:hypothetical protein